MSAQLSIKLDTPPELAAQLQQLQIAFAEVCNAIAPIVRDTRCWNRVALHHLVYRGMRERFPHLGSQMVCNAIYSVSRTCRILFQGANSPFNVGALGNKPLPQMSFAPTAPVYFDRHTLSIRDGIVSMYTLEGRIRFKLSISADDEERFRQQKLREIVLTAQAGQYQLRFLFAQDDAPAAPEDTLPEYVIVHEDDSERKKQVMGESA